MEKELPEARSFTVIKELKHKFFTLLLRSDGIVQMNTDDDAFFTIVEAKEYVDLLGEITGGVPHLILKNPGKHATVDSETRSFMAEANSLRFSIAEAVIIQNTAQRIIGNFYIRFDKPSKPVKLFDTTEAAEQWLRSLKGNK